MGKVGAFFAGLFVLDGLIALFMAPGQGTSFAIGLLVFGLFLSAVSSGRLMKAEGESWAGWVLGLLGAVFFCALYTINCFFMLFGMGNKHMWDKAESEAKQRKAVAQRSVANAAPAPSKRYNAVGDYVGQSFDGKSFGATGDYAGQTVDGKHYDSMGNYTGQTIDGKHYDATGNYTGQTIDGKHYDALGNYIGQSLESE